MPHRGVPAIALQMAGEIVDLVECLIELQKIDREGPAVWGQPASSRLPVPPGKEPRGRERHRRRCSPAGRVRNQLAVALIPGTGRDLQVNTYGDAFNVPLGFLPGRGPGRPGRRRLVPHTAGPTPINFLQFDEAFQPAHDLSGHLQAIAGPLVGHRLPTAAYLHPPDSEYEHWMPPFSIDNNVPSLRSICLDRWRVSSISC